MGFGSAAADPPDGRGEEAGLRRPPRPHGRPALRRRADRRADQSKAMPPSAAGRSTRARAGDAVPAGMPRAVPADTTYFCRRRRPGQRRLVHPHALFAGFGSGVTRAGHRHHRSPTAARAFIARRGPPEPARAGQADDAHAQLLLVTDGDALVLVGGTPGGDSQPQWNLQALTDLLDFGLNVQAGDRGAALGRARRARSPTDQAIAVSSCSLEERLRREATSPSWSGWATASGRQSDTLGGSAPTHPARPGHRRRSSAAPTRAGRHGGRFLEGRRGAGEHVASRSLSPSSVQFWTHPTRAGEG